MVALHIDEYVSEQTEQAAAPSNEEQETKIEETGKQETAPKKARKKKKKRKKRHPSKMPVWQIIGLIIGLCMLAWPIVADRISAYEADQAITEYTRYVQMDPEQVNALLDNAHAYNDRLAGIPNPLDPQVVPYDQQLNTGNGNAFGWIEIPSLSEKVPIYHGTGDDALQIGVGHLEGTSLPIGGTSAHSVLTGHSGMPGSRMFDDIDQLKTDDIVLIHVLDNVFAYKVVESEVVWPWEVDNLGIVNGKDMITLVTCTPYGVNDHRLLVHAERTDYAPEMEIPQSNMALFLNMRTIPFIIAIIVIVLFFAGLATSRRRRYPKELGVYDPWNGLSDATDDKRYNLERLERGKRKRK